MITDGMRYKLSGIHSEISKTMRELRRKKELGQPIQSEVQKIEKFALSHGATKDWRYNSGDLKDVEKLAYSAYLRLRMDIDGYKHENPEHHQRLDEMEKFFSGDHSTEKLDPKDVEDARRMIGQTDDPDAIMEIIGTQDRLDRYQLIQENWDKIGSKYSL